MRLTLIALLMLMLLQPRTVMTAAGDACALFVRSVLPGLLPYMTLSLMLVSRVPRMNPLLLTLLGWGGGSPTGGRLLALCPGLTAREQAGLARKERRREEREAERERQYALRQEKKKQKHRGK